MKRVFRQLGLTRISLVAIVAILFGIIVVLVAQPDKTPAAETTNQKANRQVEIISVASLLNNREPLSIIGTVESTNEARIRVETQGEVVRVRKQLGERVAAGEIIAELENELERAALVQAEGAVEGARAQLQKITGGVRDQEVEILDTGVQSAETNVNEAKTFSVNTINGVFVTADDVIRNRVDVMFSDPQEQNPQINFPVRDSQLEIDLENDRLVIGESLDTWSDSLDTLTRTTFSIAAFEVAEDNLNAIRDFLDELALGVNDLSPSLSIPQSTIDLWKGNIAASRNSLSGALASLSGAKDNLTNKQAALDIAIQQRDIGVTGGSKEDVATAEATLKQAQAAFRSAQISFERTILRTPISGTINTLDIKQGDFVSVFQLIAVVSNNNALEIEAFITNQDKDFIVVGAPVLINDRWNGVVTTVAPAVNEVTKKVEIKVGIIDTNTNLLNGESATLEIARIKNGNAEETIIVPVSAIKIGFEETLVFTVDDDNVLIAHPVEIGPLVGQDVVIRNGVTPDMNIVLDARGLEAGQTVSVSR